MSPEPSDKNPQPTGAVAGQRIGAVATGEPHRRRGLWWILGALLLLLIAVIVLIVLLSHHSKHRHVAARPVAAPPAATAPSVTAPAAATTPSVTAPAVTAASTTKASASTGCPRATGRITGDRLGPVKLTDSRTAAKRPFTRSSERGTHYEDFFCLTPVGIRVGYGSPKLLKTLPANLRTRYADRVVFASTANAHYDIKTVRPGMTIGRARMHLQLGRVFSIGANDWYLAPDGPVSAVLKTRDGRVQEVGIAPRSITRGRAGQHTFLTSF